MVKKARRQLEALKDMGYAVEYLGDTTGNISASEKCYDSVVNFREAVTSLEIAIMNMEFGATKLS